MGRIYAVGEALVDIIFSSGQPKAAKAGGSMLNSAVSLGRIGLPVSLITEYAEDDPGHLIESFLSENHVDTSCSCRFRNGKTAIALAFLNENNDARYTFYKNYPEKRFEIEFPLTGGEDFLLYGSIYSVTPEIRANFIRLVRGASEAGSFLIYDPNFRKSHSADLPAMKPLIMENIRLASLVRGSDEDFYNIFGVNGPDEAWEKLKPMVGCMVYTANVSGVHVRSSAFSGSFPVASITPVSTIGAGDNFNAGLIASFYSRGIRPSDLQGLGENEWRESIETAVSFATNVCLSYENYIDLAFASRYRSASRFQI